MEGKSDKVCISIPRSRRWTAGQRWRCLRCQRIQPQSGRCSRGRWQWSRPQAALPPDSTAPLSGERWRWRSTRWIQGLGTHTRPECGQWCAAGLAHSGWGLPWPSGQGTPRGGWEKGKKKTEVIESLFREGNPNLIYLLILYVNCYQWSLNKQKESFQSVLHVLCIWCDERRTSDDKLARALKN